MPEWSRRTHGEGRHRRTGNRRYKRRPAHRAGRAHRTSGACCVSGAGPRIEAQHLVYRNRIAGFYNLMRRRVFSSASAFHALSEHDADFDRIMRRMNAPVEIMCRSQDFKSPPAMLQACCPFPPEPEMKFSDAEAGFVVYDVFSSESAGRQSAGGGVRRAGTRRCRWRYIAGRVQPVGDLLSSCRRRTRSTAPPCASFTPMHELPLPDIRLSALLIAITEAAGEGAPSIFVLEEKVGPVRCAVSRDDSGIVRRIRPAAPARTGAVHGRSCCDRRATGLSPQDIGFENHGRYPIFRRRALHPGARGWIGCCWSGDARCAGLARLDRPAEALSPAAFVHRSRRRLGGNAFHARMFAGHLGIPEDPATGSAVAALAGAITQFDRPADGVWPYPIEQGVEMGRPSPIRLELDVARARLPAPASAAMRSRSARAGFWWRANIAGGSVLRPGSVRSCQTVCKRSCCRCLSCRGQAAARPCSA